MKIFDALSRTDYQDLLRAIGLLLDERGLRDIRMWEHAGGLMVQGRGRGEPTYQTIAFTDAELLVLLRQSYDRRGHTPGRDEAAV